MERIQKILSVFDTQKYVFDVHPVPKPRMVRSDTWKKRDVTTKYWAFKDAIILESKKVNLLSLPGFIPMILFYVKIPKGKAKKTQEGDIVETRPDVDNYLKSLLDCMESEDNYIHTLCMSKRYSKNPRIEIYIEK